ncbi:MAG TPA: tetratricopeptide repeat protein [Treponemataceae bacterium]|nr:tetratricopeptide repeat protein [Treponemataceae bacterium]
MAKTWFETQLSQALCAGRKRDYRKAVTILENLAARGYAENGDRASGGHPELYLYLARSYHALGNFARAVAYARLYLELRPDDGSGWFFLGRTYLASGTVHRAVFALRTSLEKNPESVDARALLGMAYLKAKKPIIARAVFEEALERDPDNPRLNEGYRNALFIEAIRTYKRGDAEQARQMLTFLINNDIDGVVPRLYLAHTLRDLGYLPEALGEYENAALFSPEDEVLPWYRVAVLLEMGRAPEAHALMAELGAAVEGASAVSPEVVNTTIIRTHLESGQWAKAAQAARVHIRNYGPSAQVHALMGEAQRNLGNVEAAVNHFNRALELDREHPEPYYGILMVFKSERDWEGLCGVANRAERAGCDPALINYYRTLCRANMDTDPAVLLPELQEAVLQIGADPELMEALARTYFRVGLFDLSVGWYDKVLHLEQGNEDAWLGYIASLEQLDDTAQRLEAYRGYLALWGDNSGIRRDLVNFLEENEQWEDAADQLEILLGQFPSSGIERQLALYRRKAGQYRKAAILYRSLLRETPDDRSLLSSLVYCLDRMGETDSARKLMQSANKAFKPTADSLLIEGRLCVRAKDYQAALVIFRKVVDRFPKDTRGWEEVAHVYDLQGVPEMAATFRQKARDTLNSGKKKKK